MNLKYLSRYLKYNIKTKNNANTHQISLRLFKMVYNIFRNIQIKLIKMNVNIILSHLKLSAFNYCY